jgi:preprotein translocase subunit SecY
VFVERAESRIIVVFSKRQSGTRIFGGDASHLTLKPNLSGVTAPVLASALLAVPLTAAQFPGGIGRGEWLGELTDRIVAGPPIYLAIYAGLIVILAFLCSKTMFGPARIAESLRQHAGSIPGVRPGKDTAERLRNMQTRLSMMGVAYLLLVCLLPDLLIAHYGRPFHLDGTSLFIMVVVGVDIIRRIRNEPSISSS